MIIIKNLNLIFVEIKKMNKKVYRITCLSIKRPNYNLYLVCTSIGLENQRARIFRVQFEIRDKKRNAKHNTKRINGMVLQIKSRCVVEQVMAMDRHVLTNTFTYTRTHDLYRQQTLFSASLRAIYICNTSTPKSSTKLCRFARARISYRT